MGLNLKITYNYTKRHNLVNSKTQNTLLTFYSYLADGFLDNFYAIYGTVWTFTSRLLVYCICAVFPLIGKLQIIILMITNSAS